MLMMSTITVLFMTTNKMHLMSILLPSMIILSASLMAKPHNMMNTLIILEMSILLLFLLMISLMNNHMTMNFIFLMITTIVCEATLGMAIIICNLREEGNLPQFINFI